MNGKYLTEELLGDFLQVAYEGQTWDHDKKFKIPNSEISHNFRPDYCCHNLKLCVEFDGPDHFTKANVIQADITKDTKIESHGYKVIRIPYFIQLTKESIRYFFNMDLDFNNNFKHGFISKKVVLPTSFCEQGIWKFKNMLYKLESEKEIFSQIKESIKDKINAIKVQDREMAILQVIPSSLKLLLGLQEKRNDINLFETSLRDNWNCVMLESSQNMQSLDGIYDMKYSYNSKGDIVGYSFKWYITNTKLCYLFEFFAKECTNEPNSVNLRTYINGELKKDVIVASSDIHIYNITDYIYFI